MAAVENASADAVAAASALSAAAAALDIAAWHEGIHQDGVLGPVVQAFHDALVCLADLMARSETAMNARLQALQYLSEGERQKLTKMVEAATASVAQARQAQVNLELDRERVTARLVEHLGPHLAEGLKHWRVIRETEHHRRKARRLAGGVTLPALALLAAGYGGKAWEDRPASTMFETCMTHRLVEPGSGRSYCEIPTER